MQIDVEYEPIRSFLDGKFVTWEIQAHGWVFTYVGIHPSPEMCDLATDLDKSFFKSEDYLYNDLPKDHKWEIFEFMINELILLSVTPIGADERIKNLNK